MAQALIQAIRVNDEKGVERLLPSANVNDLFNDHTPLNFAIYCGRKEIVELLLRQHNIDVTRRNGSKPRGYIFHIGHGQWRETNFIDENVALKTPLEVAQYRKRQDIILLLNDHFQRKLVQANQEQQTQAQPEQEEGQQQEQQLLTNQTERQQERKDDEAALDGEVHETESSKCKAAISKATGKSESEVRQMMRRGEVPANMWSAVWSRCSESQKNIPKLEQEQTDTTAELTKVNEQIAQMQQEKKDLEQRLKDVQQTLKRTMVSPQVLHTVETLARAEQNEQKQLEAQLKAEKENTILSIEELGYFLNAVGILGSTRKLISLAEQEHVTEMSLGDMYHFLYDNMEMESKLEARFAIDMVRHNQYPPYDEHRKECPVCRNSVAELLTEYQISLKESKVAKISSSGLMYLERADLNLLSEANTTPTERLQSIKAINMMRQNHVNFITVEQ